MLSNKKNLKEMNEEECNFNNPFGTRYDTESIPKYEIPKRECPQNMFTKEFMKNSI